MIPIPSKGSLQKKGRNEEPEVSVGMLDVWNIVICERANMRERRYATFASYAPKISVDLEFGLGYYIFVSEERR